MRSRHLVPDSPSGGRSRAERPGAVGLVVLAALAVLALLAPAAQAGLARAKEPRISTYVSGLKVPWEIGFLPGGRALITERPGTVRIVNDDGKLRGRAARIDVSARGEGGLLGLALDPGYEDNRFVYLYFTTGSGMELARYRFKHGRLKRDALVLDGIRAGDIHDSGRIAFGPDDRLYVATGDAGQPDLAQDPDSLNGKFLRLSKSDYRGRDSKPTIFSLGHRNPQGLDWQPGSDRLFATEHGPTGDDEVNIIAKGENYGWPEVTGREHGRFKGPVAVYDGLAPSGATFVSRPRSKWTGDYLIGGLAGQKILKLKIDGRRVVKDRDLFEGYGRIRTVVEGPRGALFALTSNRDGRGSPGKNDDRVLRIVPPKR